MPSADVMYRARCQLLTANDHNTLKYSVLLKGHFLPLVKLNAGLNYET